MANATAYKGVIQNISRRKKLISSNSNFVNPPMMSIVNFRPGLFRVALRLVYWIFAPAFFYLGVFIDYIRGKRGVDARAIRLRKTFEKLGGTFIKIGQQLSLRADILPFQYCQELANMLDKVPAFDTQYAIDRIEDSTGKKLSELFSVFDPKPIGSASIACVYQAKFLNGQKVAVKVRRPNIGNQFAADFIAIDILSTILEVIGVLNPGFTKNIRRNLKQVLTEELDFRKEARHQELFRRSAKKTKRKSVTAPKVYFQWSGEDVIVMEFIDGMTLLEVVTAVETKDEKVLSIMAQRKIKPKKVARKLVSVNYAGMISELFFHADPHPENVIVQEKGKLVFIDFGSCGFFSKINKRHLREISYYQQHGDPEGMAQASIAIAEPMPLVDLEDYINDVSKFYRTSVYAMKSKHAHWWERTSAVQWIAFLKASVKHKVPLPDGMLHMIRATLLYDTMAARLYNKLNFYKEYRRYEKYAGKAAKKRLEKRFKRDKKNGYVRLEQLVESGNDLITYVQRFIDDPPMRFVHGIGKSAHSIILFIRFLAVVATVFIILVAGTALINTIRGIEFTFWEIAKNISINKWFIIFFFFGILINTKMILFRMKERNP